MRGQPSQRRPIRLSVRKKILFSTIVIGFFLVALYALITLIRGHQLYKVVKLNERGWRGHLFAIDPVLGFAPMPYASGTELLPYGTEIPVRFDGDGFRIPENQNSVAASGNLRAIALGCSFTFGAACPAEETYPYHLSTLLKFRCVNAGVPSYGLAQMVILARRLIPRFKPDYVIVQYSPWLVDRSQTYYAPSHYGRFTCPYFTKTANGEIAIHPPVFAERVTELPISEFRGTRSGLEDWLSFLARVGVPLYLHDDFHAATHALKRFAAMEPRPCDDGQAIVNDAYGEIAQLCKSNNAKLIILVLGAFTNRDDRHSLDRIPDAQVVDAHAALLKRLRMVSVEDYAKVYCHWGGKPPKLVDSHPNAKAHWLITLELTAAIREMEEARREEPPKAQESNQPEPGA